MPARTIHPFAPRETAEKCDITSRHRSLRDGHARSARRRRREMITGGRAIEEARSTGARCTEYGTPGGQSGSEEAARGFFNELWGLWLKVVLLLHVRIDQRQSAPHGPSGSQPQPAESNRRNGSANRSLVIAPRLKTNVGTSHRKARVDDEIGDAISRPVEI